MASVVLKSLPIVTVTTKGTAVPISSVSIDKVVAVYISAPAANTGSIMVGDSSVDGVTLSGLEVHKGGAPFQISYSDHYIDLQGIYVDALNNGDKATVSYLQVV